MKRAGIGAVSLLVAAALWLPCVHLLFAPSADDLPATGIAPLARSLTERQLRLWSDDDLRAVEIAKMRSRNAVWDFMARTFLVLALANLAERDPADRARCLTTMDAIIEETVRLEQANGHTFFLLSYARRGEWKVKPGRSLFVDGEIALMLAARCMVEDRPDYRPRLQARVATITAQMEQGPILSGESYPDECWTFCNSVALAAITIADVLDGTDHSAFQKRWIANAREHLVHEPTGMLVSSYHLDGRPRDGPEGSTIWLVAHCLQIVDPAFAREQYDLARKQLGVELLGFGYAKEWPPSWVGLVDIDSGPIVPVFEASSSSSGFALLGAASFGDAEYLESLVTSLNMAAFPVDDGEGVRYAASNQVGDAVLAYALTCGPLWQKVLKAR
jgi:hypothetical protein